MQCTDYVRQNTYFIYFTLIIVKVSIASQAIREQDVKLHHYITVISAWNSPGRGGVGSGY